MVGIPWALFMEAIMAIGVTKDCASWSCCALLKMVFSHLLGHGVLIGGGVTHMPMMSIGGFMQLSKTQRIGPAIVVVWNVRGLLKPSSSAQAMIATI
jgi:hypothetical protein